LHWVRFNEPPWTEHVDSDYSLASSDAVEKWKDLKLGIRIHFGVYSMEGSDCSWALWSQKGQKGKKPKIYPASTGLSNDEYVEWMKRYCTYYQDFNPKLLDATEWARLFKNSGAKFAVFTANHHDGFRLWHTKTKINALRRAGKDETGKPTYENVWIHYSIEDTPYKKDIVQEYVEAIRKEGLAVGLYYSHPNWMDYAARFSQHNIYRDPDYTRQSDPKGWERAILRHREEIRELCSNYGKIDILSFDHGLPMDCWPELKETLKMIRSLQPDIMMRHRGIGNWGDYFTPEGKGKTFMDYYDERIYNKKPWSVIGATGITPNYSPPELQEYPTVQSLIEKFIPVIACGGNYQLGFGPSPQGKFDDGAIKIMKEFGSWLKVNGEAIYATRPRLCFKEGDNIWFTRSKDYRYIYPICLKWPGEKLILRTVRAVTGSRIYLYGIEKPLLWSQNNEGLTIEIPEELQDPQGRPCEYAWAFKIEAEPTYSGLR
jgi:alpha-L-fucosidase